MSTEVVVAVVTVVGVLGAAWLNNRKVRGDVADVRDVAANAHTAAVAARNYSRPTGNGYAEETTAALRRIEDAQDEFRKDLGGLRSEIRTDRRTTAEGLSELRQANRDLAKRVDTLHPAPAVVANTNPQE